MADANPPSAPHERVSTFGRRPPESSGSAHRQEQKIEDRRLSVEKWPSMDRPVSAERACKQTSVPQPGRGELTTDCDPRGASAKRPASACQGFAMKRVMIVGQPGSGKSTLAAALGEITGLPVVHIDKIHWQFGWVERRKAEKTRLCLEADEREHWIFEGGHSATWPSRLNRADILIWLDLPVGMRLWRVLWRAVTGLGRTRPDMADGCPERLRSLPDFLGYIWQTRNSARTKIARLIATAPAGCAVVHLRSDADSAVYLRSFQRP